MGDTVQDLFETEEVTMAAECTCHRTKTATPTPAQLLPPLKIKLIVFASGYLNYKIIISFKRKILIIASIYIVSVKQLSFG